MEKIDHPEGENNFKILSNSEVLEQNLKVPNDNMLVCIQGGSVAKRFKDYCVTTTPACLQGHIEFVRSLPPIKRKHFFAAILRSLHRWTDAELNDHFERITEDWQNWCDDVALYFACNAVLFDKGIPCCQVTDEAASTIHATPQARKDLYDSIK